MTNPILDMFKSNNPVQPNPQQNNQPFPTSLDDPRMDGVKKYVASHGGDPQQAFYQLCREKMVNPANLLNMMFGRK